jgi:hypothetical protein
MRIAAPLLAMLLLPPLLAACEVPHGVRPEEDEMLPSEPIDAMDMELLWAILETEIERTGLKLDELESSQRTGEFESYWQNSLSVFRYEGRRRKLLGKVLAEPGRPGRFRVLATIWVQRNADIEDPGNPEKAIWQDEPPDVASTRVFLYAVEQHFLSDEERYGGSSRKESDSGR